MWPNGADFDPCTLHDRPTVCDEFVKMAEGYKDQEIWKAARARLAHHP